MRRIWRRKWIIVPVTAAIVLAAGAVGAVALAGPGTEGSEIVALESVTATTWQAAGEVGQGGVVAELGERRGKLQERLERIKQRWLEARSRMTPEDQATFDRLTEKAKGQREALREAGKDLAETLKEMRALVREYRPPTTTTSAP